MMARKLVILFSLWFVCFFSFSQATSSESTLVSDSTTVTSFLSDTVYPRLNDPLYYDSSILGYDYDYRRANRIKTLRYMSREVIVYGLISCLGILFANGYLAIENDWSLWIDIPCATVLTVGVMQAFNLWSVSLKKKAEALEVSTLYFHDFNGFYVGTSVFSCSQSGYCSGLGLGIKTTF